MAVARPRITVTADSNCAQFSERKEEEEEEGEPEDCLKGARERLRHAARKMAATPVVSQRELLAKLSPLPPPPVEVVRCTAEISIQHCSFFQLNERLRIPEKNVRINLRLTERAPAHAQVKIALRAPPRLGFARADIRMDTRKSTKELRRTQTQVRVMISVTYFVWKEGGLLVYILSVLSNTTVQVCV